MSEASHPENMVEIKDLYHAFNEEEPVLNGIDLTVLKGGIRVILGGSGSGKSTILRLILGLIKPQRGSIEVDGEDVVPMQERELQAVRKKIGMVFQSAALFDSLSVRENVGYRLYEEGLDEEEIEKRVLEKLSFVHLEETMDMYPVELSGGMKKRVAIARALASNPQLILFDEPTTGLDPITANEVTDHILELNRRWGVTSIVVTHDLKYAFKVARKFAMIKDGKIIFDGTEEELRGVKDPYIQEFLA